MSTSSTDIQKLAQPSGNITHVYYYTNAEIMPIKIQAESSKFRISDFFSIHGTEKHKIRSIRYFVIYMQSSFFIHFNCGICECRGHPRRSLHQYCTMEVCVRANFSKVWTVWHAHTVYCATFLSPFYTVTVLNSKVYCLTLSWVIKIHLYYPALWWTPQ